MIKVPDQDSFEPFENLRQMEALKDLEEPMCEYKPRNCFEEAMSKLSETAIPKNIPCRSKEKEKVREFLLEGIKKLGVNQTLYLSGVPGIGKTLTVNEVVDSLKNEPNWKKNVKLISLNATKLPKPDSIYLSLFRELTGEPQTSVSKALRFLDEIFTKGILPVKMTQASKAKEKDLKERIAKVKVIFIDELDYLYTKDEQILYNLFEWTQKNNSKIVMVTISNTIDFPERLEEKIMSRIGNARLVFHPYTADELETIVKDRIQDTGVFNSEAIRYACKKVAHFSSDIRKCLQVLREALTLLMKDRPVPGDKVTIEMITRAHQSLYSGAPLNNLIKAPYEWKIVLTTLCERIRTTGTGCLYSQLEYELKGDSNDRLFKQLMHILFWLKEMNIVTIRQVKRLKDNRVDKSIPITNNFWDHYIELTVSLDQLLYAIGDEITIRRLPV